jgi:hypothetical protein
MQTDGLLIQDQPRLPDVWPVFEPALIASHFRSEAERLLGYDDPHAFAYNTDPRTPLQHIAAITLVDEELQLAIANARETFVTRSHPYATHRPIPGPDPTLYAFLYCHPSQRPRWRDFLCNSVKLSDEANAEAYATFEPHTVILCQVALAIPGGAIDGLSRWMTVGNEAHLKQVVPRIYDRGEFCEQRLLRYLPRDSEIHERMFVAAEKARLIHQVGDPPTGYVLTRPDPRLENLFAAVRHTPTWHEPEFFRALLETGSAFQTFLQQAFQHITDLDTVCARLARDHDADRVASELASLGILLANRAGQYKLNHTPKELPLDAPSGLYRTETVALVGLSREDFVAAIQTHHLLCNVLFWAIRDAYQLRQLSAHDVPDCIRDFDDSADSDLPED